MVGEKHRRDSNSYPASYLQRLAKGKKGDKTEDIKQQKVYLALPDAFLPLAFFLIYLDITQKWSV